MLENVKSSYILEIIMSHISEEKKLKLVIYNKTLQNRINIKLINYKLLSDKYIVHESERIIREYYAYNNRLIFEGEYKNGKKNGKGKEYNKFLDCNLIYEGEYEYNKFLDGNLIYEGEYLDGKRNGKGKEYYYNGKLKFEGEYLNGKKLKGEGYNIKQNFFYQIPNEEGIINEYDEYGTLIFEGIYLKGEKNGKGREYDIFSGNLIFEGEYLNDKKNGKGKEYNNQGVLIFEREYLNGKKWTGIGYDDSNDNKIYELKNGKGYIKNSYFEGWYENGEKNGKGKELYNGKILSECEYLNGKKIGKGVEYDKNGYISFKGEYLYNYKIKGKEYNKKKLIYEGEYLFNRKWNGKGYDDNGNIIYELINGNGKVKEYFRNELIFEGEYLDGKKNGKGKEYDYLTGQLLFDGEFKNGIKNGKGKEYDILTGKLIYEGELINGVKNGTGKEYDKFTGQLLFEGEFINGKMIKKGICIIY